MGGDRREGTDGRGQAGGDGRGDRIKGTVPVRATKQSALFARSTSDTNSREQLEK
jgi:hypothetical protein